ncbi:MAG: DUF4412 domain-containing protein [Candidatus Eisenbacteria bacterium]|uniref:DUF4412 domain-containing protein n=1 Tax=Eiseniibacteriota bacterium TaxID=2212470 RepID=A0A956RN00_UNCEI|nr:DUF4412 domain-containing protein [Candidatus Eisenbacteria bacterium]
MISTEPRRVNRSGAETDRAQTGAARGGRSLSARLAAAGRSTALPALLALASVTLVVPAASADTTVTMKNGNEEVRVRFTPESIRIDAEQTILFDAKAQVLRVLQSDEQKYMEITKEDLEKLGQTLADMQSQMAPAMKQAEAALAQLPAEQRAMAMEKMKAAMGQMESGTVENKVTEYVKADGSETIAGVKCQKYRVVKGDETTGEAWMAQPKALGMEKDDLAAFHGLAEFGRTLQSKVRWSNDAFANLDPEAERFAGFPMRIVGADGSQEMEVLSIDHGKLDGAIFRVPDGWERSSMLRP